MLHQIQPNDHGPLGQSMSDAVSKCVHCGFCLAACPTYEVMGQEADSPRGRIVLMKNVLEGKLTVEQVAVHTDACLGCLACEPACPSGVPYRDLISPFRAISESQRKRTVLESFSRWVIQSTLPFPKRFRWALKTGYFARPLSGLLPKPFRSMLQLLPRQLPKSKPLQTVYPAIGKQKMRVGLLAGCAQSVLDPDINIATIEVLTRNGVEVVIPKHQACCGALSWHVGNLSAAQAFAQQNLKAFSDDLDWIVTNAAGCGSGLHEYHLILKGTKEEKQAEVFRHRVIDVSVLLMKLDLVESLQKLPRLSSLTKGVNTSVMPLKSNGISDQRKLRVAYHDACHLANAQGVRTQPRQLLNAIPGVEVIEIPDGHLCCGSAGTYNIDQPEIADQLGKAKVGKILSTKPDVIATGNIGCMTQLKLHLEREAGNIPVLHTVQILRDAYHSAVV